MTGANRGLGREFVRQLLERVVTKVYVAARDPKTIDAPDPRGVPLQLDVTDPDSIAGAAELADAVSLQVNNAQHRRGCVLAVTSAFAESVTERSGVVVNDACVLSWLALGG